MSYRFKIAAWFGISLTALSGLLIITAHWHLDEELRKDRWDRSHPKYPNWVIHGSYTNEEVHDILGELIKIWLWVGVPSVATSLGVGLLLAHRSVRPVRLINEQLEALTPATMRSGITSPENDPALGDLVANINSLLDRAGVAYEQMAGFSSLVAHELRTPLTLLRMRIEQSTGEMPEEMQEGLQDELARLSQFVERSLLAAKAESGSLEPSGSLVDVSKLLEDIGEGYGMLAAEKNIQFIWQTAVNLTAFTDADLLRQVIHNLLGNALRFARSKIEVNAWLDDDTPVLKISNDDNPRLAPTAGLGLGLRLVRSICSITSMPFKTDRNPSGFSATLRISNLSNV